MKDNKISVVIGAYLCGSSFACSSQCPLPPPPRLLELVLVPSHVCENSEYVELIFYVDCVIILNVPSVYKS